MKDGYEIVKCPACFGASNVERSSPGAYAAFMARDRAQTAITRQQLGLPPLGEQLASGGERTAATHDAPPEGFATPAHIPNSEREDRMQAARANMHKQIAAVAARMKGV